MMGDFCNNLVFQWTVSFYVNLCIRFLDMLSPVIAFIQSIFQNFVPFLPKSVQRFLQRDGIALSVLVKLGFHAKYNAFRNMTVAKLFEETVQKYGNKTAFKYNDQNWTFRQLNDYKNQVANYFQSKGDRKKGDVVGLIATSCPQYPAIWLGLNQLGCVTALININLSGDALRHAITVAQCKTVIIAVDLLGHLLDIIDDLPGVDEILVFCEGNSSTYTGAFSCFDDVIAKMPKTKPAVKDGPGYLDNVVYIYTSGTTGFPKPCNINSNRAWMVAVFHSYVTGMTDKDVLLTALPLYHTAGGLVSCGQALFMGTTVVMKKSFSASKFWDDVRKYKCTVFQYIGELCRYILAQPRKPTDADNTIRLMYGVGLRAQIWPDFVSRFNIPKVVELYGSTEGNVSLMNVDGKPGAIGYGNGIREYLKHQVIIKVDMETNEPIRDSRGHCIVCKAGEPGECVGKIAKTGITAFEGYLQKDATAKKVLLNVFKQGDGYFRTGDIMFKDQEGYIFFVDRSGDTFRWKGENVSTSEVEGTISRLVGNLDVAVYGVSVPGCEGRAGMACISGSDEAVDIDKLGQDIKKNLAVYARPLFLRFQNIFQVTGTFKIMKGKLKEDGFDYNKCGTDQLYYWDPSSAEYRQMDAEAHRQVVEGSLRY